ncbi:MAG TPA: phage tail length tape measure family protein [Rhodanobacteraceae bacterium]|nr:phage tail length tape measure family protein [Rhodanobacteraceae bacterium]
MATAAEMIVRLLADTSSFNANMEEAAVKVRASQDAMAASMQSSMSVFQQFDAIEKANLKTAQDVAAAQKVITAAQQSAAFTAEELAAKQAIVTAALAKIPREAEAAAASFATMGINSRAAYSASALISDALTGQFSRSHREVAALANETGLMSRALQFAMGPVGLTIGGFGLLGLSAVKAQEDLDDFGRSVELTNGYMGESAGEMQALAKRIADITGSYDTAKQAVIDLANSGRFTSDQLLQAATAATEFADLTGQKVSEVDRLLIEMATNPQKALDELVDKYHRVTPAQAEMIEGLIKQGDKAAATAALVKAMGDSVAASMDKQTQHAGVLDRMLTRLAYDFGQVWRGIGESVNLATGGGDTAEKLAAIQHRLQDMRTSHETTGGYAVAYEALQKQAAELQAILDKQKEVSAEAKRTADAYAAAHPAQGSFGALQKEGFGGIDLSGNLTKQLQDLEAAQKVSYGDREEFEREYWGTILQQAKAGTAAYVQAWQQVQTGQQRLDQQQLQESEETARKQEELSRKATETAKRQSEQEAEAAKKAARERLAADEQVADSAHNLAIARIDASLQGDRTDLANNRITLGEMLQDQLNALNQRLTADIQHYQKRAKLAAGDAAEVAKWNGAILVDVDKTNAAMLRAEQAYADAVKRLNREIADEKISDDQRMIMSGFRAVNQLIGHQETFKQVVANIGMEILETQEQNVAKGIAEAFNGEQGKTAAAEAGAAERLGITVAGEAQALAVQGASAVKWIMTEAAKAAAGAFNAMVSIPYIGPFVAVGASVAAFAAVSKLVSSVASAEGGWERVPADGMMTELHRDEMVLPARFANPMRDMVENGGGMGGTHHYHYNIQAYDRRGFADFVSRNGIELGNGLRRLGRNGHRL